MWLITSIGFFSIVQKPGDKANGTLTVRSRVQSDLAALKQYFDSGESDIDQYTNAIEYTYNVASPFLAAERGELDGIIEPAQTRVAVAKALRSLRGKRVSATG